MIYEIVNPSDPYTLVADDVRVAVAVVTLLGSGWYGLKAEEGDTPSTFFGLMNDETMLKALEAMEIGDLLGFIKSHEDEIAACLESVSIGGIDERKDYESALSHITDPEERESFIRERHDRRRTSINDIGSRAWRMADRLKEVPTP